MWITMRPENKSTYFKIEISKEGDTAKGTIEIKMPEKPPETPLPETTITPTTVVTEIAETKTEETEVKPKTTKKKRKTKISEK